MDLTSAFDRIKAMTDRPFVLSEGERLALLRIGEAMMPATDILPAFDGSAARRIEAFLAAGSPPEIRLLFRAMLNLIERGALLKHRRTASSLEPYRRFEYLDRAWVHGAITNRLPMRLFTVMLKGSYYDDPRVYQALGMDYERPPVAEDRPRWTAQIRRGADLADDTFLEADAVVVGTGAGGAAAALELASRGHAVVMLEEGGHFTRRDFNGRGYQMQRLLYQHYGLSAVTGNVTIPVPLGKTLGGTTTVNSGTCFRTPERTLSRWRTDHGLSAYTPEEMEPYFRKIEAVFRVTPADMKHVGKNGEIIARGAQKLGFRHGPLPRNAPDCDGQALCCFGCPSGAKRSADMSLIPAALERGAQVICRVRVERIVMDGRRAVGVEGRSLDTGKKVTVSARAVVLAMGAFGTPRFLMAQRVGNSSGQVGRNLSIHPATALFALMDEPVEPHKAIPQGYMVDEFHEDGLLFEGGTLPLEMFAMMVPQIGFEGQRLMQSYRRISMFGVMVHDKTRGRVLPGSTGAPLGFYWLNDEDFSTMRRGIELLTRVYLAAGAREVHAMVFGWKPMRHTDDLADNMALPIRPLDVDISAYHPLGTCHMGGDRARCVCSPDGAVWDVPGLSIADGSLIPPGLGVNPQVTIAAVATRVAEKVASTL